MKIKLNKRTIDQTVYQGSGGHYLWDTELAGFGVRIYPTGRKSFVISYRSKGLQRFFTIGRYGVLTVQQARLKAMATFARIGNGEDPSGDKIAANRAPRITDLAKRYMDEHSRVKKKPKSIKKDEQAWERLILPHLGQRRVKDIARADIAKTMTDLADTPAMANKVLTILSKSFNLAEIWGWRTEGTNPCRHIKRYKEEARERYLSEAELSRLGDVLIEAERFWEVKPQAIAAVRLLILTGCRSAEILTLKWDEVDFERRCLHLTDSKTGKKKVWLNAGALEILSTIERVDGNPHVVPGASPGSHFSTLQRLWNRIRKAANIRDVRIHDLRHNFASIGINTGQNLAVIGKILGHTKIQTTQRYAHLADAPVRKANEQIGATLEATLAGQNSTEATDRTSADSPG